MTNKSSEEQVSKVKPYSKKTLRKDRSGLTHAFNMFKAILPSAVREIEATFEDDKASRREKLQAAKMAIDMYVELRELNYNKKASLTATRSVAEQEDDEEGNDVVEEKKSASIVRPVAFRMPADI
jgi:hypothetical protein